MDGSRHRDRLAACGVDTGNAYFRIKQQLMVTQDALGERGSRPDGGINVCFKHGQAADAEGSGPVEMLSHGLFG